MPRPFFNSKHFHKTKRYPREKPDCTPRLLYLLLFFLCLSLFHTDPSYFLSFLLSQDAIIGLFQNKSLTNFFNFQTFISLNFIARHFYFTREESVNNIFAIYERHSSFKRISSFIFCLSSTRFQFCIVRRMKTELHDKVIRQYGDALTKV